MDLLLTRVRSARISNRFAPAFGPVLVLLLFAGLLAAKGDLHRFLAFSNIQSMVHQSIIQGIVALGMLLIIISGGIDLSVGSVVALVTVAAMLVYRYVYSHTESSFQASAVAIPVGI